MEQHLHEAIEEGDEARVLSLVKNNPKLDVNWADVEQWPSLHVASFSGHVEVVKLLLAHPNIGVNRKTLIGQTPFSKGCELGCVSAVRLLLKDPRVDVTLDDYDGCAPLWWASGRGRYDVIEWLIASGRDLGDVKNKKGKWGHESHTALEIAKEEGHTEVESVLENFMSNPAQTRQELRVKLGMLDALAAVR